MSAMGSVFRGLRKLAARVWDALSNDRLWVAAATVAIAVTSFYQWRAINGQLTLMRSGAGDTHTLALAARKSAEAAQSAATTARKALNYSETLGRSTLAETDRQTRAMESSAAAARQSADVAGFALRVSERAWVGLENGSGTVPTKGGAGGIYMVIGITGHTPALDVREMVYDGVVLKGQQIPRLPAPKPPSGVGTTLDPGEAIRVDSRSGNPPPLPGALLSALREGRASYYCVTYIFYHDVFSSQMHVTELCRELGKGITTHSCAGFPDDAN